MGDWKSDATWHIDVPLFSWLHYCREFATKLSQHIGLNKFHKCVPGREAG